jgi:hypothetical protein
MGGCPGLEAATVHTWTDASAGGSWGWRRGGMLLARIQPAQQPIQVGAGVAPVEGDGGLLVAVLEAEQASFDLGQVAEVVGCQHLALHDGKVDLVE